MADVEVRVAESDALGTDVRRALDELWAAAFDDFEPEDRDHAYGGVHVLALREGEVVAHASAIPRRVRVGDQWFDTGYAEGVATRPDLQGLGIGTAVMAPLGEEIRRRWSMGALGTGAYRFYELLGWERWRGPSYVLRPGGEVDRTPEDDDGLMVLRFGPSAGIDLTAAICCEERPGDVW